MKVALWMAVALAFGLVGDVACKQSATSGNLAWLLIVLPIWGGVCPYLWMSIYRSGQTFTLVSVTYSPVSVLAYALLGVVLYGDVLSPRLLLAAALALGSITVASL